MEENNATLLRICNNIRIARERKGLSQKDFGKLIGLGRSTYAEYETNRIPAFEVMMKISDITGLSLTTLAYDDLSKDENIGKAPTIKLLSYAARLHALTEYSASLGSKLFSKDHQACLDEIAKIAGEYKD